MKDILKEMNNQSEKIYESFINSKFDRKIINFFIVRHLKYLYDTHKNPIYIWEAYSTCRKWKIETPHWILQYLDDCADSLLAIDKPNRASDEVYRAMNFSSATQRSPFTKRENVNLTVDIGIRSGELKEKGKKPTEVDKDLAKEFCLDIKTVRRHRLNFEKSDDTPLPST
jgi:hypothetical protein